MKFRAEKVVANLPATIEPNTLYVVRVGSGFDLYVSDSTGATAHALNSKGFLPKPDEIDDTDETYFYFGWGSVNGDWLVRRQLRSDASKDNARTPGNIYGTLTTAWPNRATLNYS